VAIEAGLVVPPQFFGLAVAKAAGVDGNQAVGPGAVGDFGGGRGSGDGDGDGAALFVLPEAEDFAFESFLAEPGLEVGDSAKVDGPGKDVGSEGKDQGREGKIGHGMGVESSIVVKGGAEVVEEKGVDGFGGHAFF